MPSEDRFNGHSTPPHDLLGPKFTVYRNTATMPPEGVSSPLAPFAEAPIELDAGCYWNESPDTGDVELGEWLKKLETIGNRS